MTTTSRPPKAVWPTVTPLKTKAASATSESSFCMVEVLLVASSLYS